jgi:hypothetical protein
VIVRRSSFGVRRSAAARERRTNGEAHERRTNAEALERRTTNV